MVHRRKLQLMKVLWGINFLVLLCGLFLPLLTVSKLILVSNTFSVVSGIHQLLLDEQYYLFGIIGIFSVVFPLTKLLLLAKWIFSANTRQPSALMNFIHLTGKWSMLDVFVVAVLVVAVKLAGLASVEMRVGLYFFSVSVILTMVLSQMVHTSSDSRH